MTREVPTVSPATSVRDAFLTMRRKRARHLVVVEDDKIVGVLSDRDVGWGDDRVEDSMSSQPITVAPEASLQDAADLMADHDVGCLPVARNGHPIGILGVRDLLRALARIAP